MVSAGDDPRRQGTIWAANLDPPLASVPARAPVTFRRVGREAAPALAAVMGPGRMAEVLARFEGGRHCYAAWAGHELAAYGWVSFEEEHVGELHLVVRLVPGEAYIWDCATLPAFRGRHLYTALLTHIAAELHANGLCRAWIGADQDNVASQRGIARAGFRPVADLVLARVLAMRLVWVLGRPGVPPGLVAEARRAYLGNRDSAWLAALTQARMS